LKILFLDIDGVMVLDIDQGIEQAIRGETSFHKPCVQALNDIISRTGCEIVVSSGWRQFFDLEQMREIFQSNGIVKTPMGFTQDYRPGQEQLPSGKELEIMRCREIMSWLGSHDVNGRFSWCAVDDMDLSMGLDNFVRCADKSYGLSYRGTVEKVASILDGIG
jgi:hypothetical protein